MNIRNLAKHLLEQATDRDDYALVVKGVRTTFESYGYLHFVWKKYHSGIQDEEVVLEEVWGENGFAEIYQAHKAFLEKMPQKWFRIIRKAVAARKAVGIELPIDIFNICRFVFALHEDVREEGAKFDIELWDDINLSLDETDRVEIKKFVGIILNNPQFHDYFIDVARYYMPSMSVVDYGYAASLIKRFGTQTGVLVDIGCGDGTKLNRLRLYGHTGELIGYEIRDLGNHWKWNKFSDISFQVIKPHQFPKQSGTVDTVTLFGIAGHWDANGLEKTLKETYRILKDSGIVVVAPMQNPSPYEEIMSYAVFKKAGEGFVKVWPEIG